MWKKGIGRGISSVQWIRGDEETIDDVWTHRTMLAKFNICKLQIRELDSSD